VDVASRAHHGVVAYKVGKNFVMRRERYYCLRTSVVSGCT
jgi:hypothetical protein